MSASCGQSQIPAVQVLNRAAQWEEEGIAFYQGIREGTPSKWVRKLAEMMARAEARHRERFMEYAVEAEEKARLSESDCPALDADAQRLLETTIFAPREQMANAAQYSGDMAMIQLAVRAEEQLALLLTQLRVYILPEQRKYVDRIITEEWGHKAKLEEMMRKHRAA